MRREDYYQRGYDDRREAGFYNAPRDIEPDERRRYYAGYEQAEDDIAARRARERAEQRRDEEAEELRQQAEWEERRRFEAQQEAEYERWLNAEAAPAAPGQEGHDG